MLFQPLINYRTNCARLVVSRLSNVRSNAVQCIYHLFKTAYKPLKTPPKNFAPTARKWSKNDPLPNDLKMIPKKFRALRREKQSKKISKNKRKRKSTNDIVSRLLIVPGKSTSLIRWGLWLLCMMIHNRSRIMINNVDFSAPQAIFFSNNTPVLWRFPYENRFPYSFKYHRI